MPQHTHSHAEGPEHEHEGATPGHSHDAAAAPAAPAPTTTAAVDVGPSAGGLSVRIVLTLLGAAAMITGGFLSWAFDDPGSKVEWAVFYNPEDVQVQASLITSAGGVFILLGLLALLGLAFRTGWLTRLSGALGIVGWVLILITLYRLDIPPEAGVSDGIAAMQIGLWLILAGGLAVVVGGFLGSRRVVSATVPAAPTP